MAYADPQTVTINAVPISLLRTGSSNNGGAFTAADTLSKLTVSHNNGDRTRHLLRFDQSKVAADPYITGVSTKQKIAAYLVVDVPPSGYTTAEAKLLVDGFVAFLAASSGAAITKLLGGEN